jgi:hypothetical protein
MQAILGGIVAAILIAIGAAMVLDTNLQQTASDRHQTTGVRL